MLTSGDEINILYSEMVEFSVQNENVDNLNMTDEDLQSLQRISKLNVIFNDIDLRAFHEENAKTQPKKMKKKSTKKLWVRGGKVNVIIE